MTTVSDLCGYLTRLAQHFDQNLRTNKNDPTQKGWGQFIAAEHHSNQIGLYGTNAGILVKTIADPTSTIDDAIVAYLTRQWNERTQSAQRYFNQTARLAFFVLALGRTTDERLITLRDVAATELVARQQPDGSWGDWRQDTASAQAPPRAETTAWASLALARVGQTTFKSSLLKSGRFLQKQALSFPQIDKAVDPLLIGAILQILPTREIHQRVRSAAIALLISTRPTTDLNIYFFDYLVSDGVNQDVKRDYLCVPRFLSYCILVSAPGLTTYSDSLRSVRIAFAHWRALAHLETILTSELLQTPRSRYPATVDQAFLALAVEFIVRHPPRFGRLYRIVRPTYHFLSGSFVFRVLLPLLLLSVLGAVAHEPANVADLIAWVRGTQSPSLTEFAEHNASVLQVLAIALGFVLGQPLLQSIRHYARDKWPL